MIAFGGSPLATAYIRVMADLAPWNAAMARLRQGLTTGLGINIAARGLAGFEELIQAPLRFEYNLARVRGVVASSSKNIEGDMAALRSAALQFGSSSMYSANQASEGFYRIAQAGYDAGEAIAGLRPILDLATIGEIQVADAATLVSRVLKQQGMDMAEAARVADLIAKASFISATGVREIGVALSYVGATAKQSGFTLEDTLAVIAALADRGMDSSRAGTSLRTVLVHLAGITEKARGVMAEYGIEVRDASGNFLPLTQILENFQRTVGRLGEVDRLRALQAIFNQRGAEAFNAILDLGVDGLERYRDGLEEVAGTSREAAEALEKTTVGAMKKFHAALENVAITIGTPVLGGLADFVNRLGSMSSGIVSIADDLRNMNDTLAASLLAVTALSAGFATLAAHPIATVLAAGVALRLGLEEVAKDLATRNIGQPGTGLERSMTRQQFEQTRLFDDVAQAAGAPFAGTVGDIFAFAKVNPDQAVADVRKMLAAETQAKMKLNSLLSLPFLKKVDMGLDEQAVRAELAQRESRTALLQAVLQELLGQRIFRSAETFTTAPPAGEMGPFLPGREPGISFAAGLLGGGAAGAAARHFERTRDLMANPIALLGGAVAVAGKEAAEAIKDPKLAMGLLGGGLAAVAGEVAAREGQVATTGLVDLHRAIQDSLRTDHRKRKNENNIEAIKNGVVAIGGGVHEIARKLNPGFAP